MSELYAGHAVSLLEFFEIFDSKPTIFSQKSYFFWLCKLVEIYSVGDFRFLNLFWSVILLFFHKMLLHSSISSNFIILFNGFSNSTANVLNRKVAWTGINKCCDDGKPALFTILQIKQHLSGRKKKVMLYSSQ